MLTKLRYIYRAYRYRRRVDPAELQFVCDTLRPGQVAVDVGCHKGAYTYWMRRSVGDSGAVFAFEPQPRQVDYLRRAFAAMRYENVTLVPMGLSATPGMLPLHIPGGAGETHYASFEPRAASREWGAGSGESEVAHANPHDSLTRPNSLLLPVTSLDAYFSEQPRGPDFLKIDVEGHELAVLEGAHETLTTRRPAILIECEARHRPDGDVRPVFDLLTSRGYRGSFFQNSRRRPLAEFDAEVHQRIDADTGSLPRGYVNNFAFE